MSSQINLPFLSILQRQLRICGESGNSSPLFANFHHFAYIRKRVSRLGAFSAVFTFDLWDDPRLLQFPDESCSLGSLYGWVERQRDRLAAVQRGLRGSPG